MTDWYFGRDSGDQCFDRLPSPDTWLQWETCGIGGNSGWVNTFDYGYLSSKNPQQRALASSLSSKGTSQADGAHEYSEFGRSADFQSLRNTTACVRPDYYFNDLTGNDSMDDIFLSSLLQDDDLPIQSLYIAVPSDSNSTSTDFQSISCDTDAVGGIHASKYSSRNHSDQSSCQSIKVPETRVMVPSDQDNLRETSDIDDFSSNEESVLVRLESVLNQLNDKTRLCFRDALYRLAKHSEQQTSNNDLVDGLPLYESFLPETIGVCSRSIMDTTESETNAIDRAVAYLMFSKVDGEQDHLPPLSPELMHNDENFAGTAASGFSDINVLGTSDRLVQCEVPEFSQQTQGLSHQLGVGSQNAF